MMRTKGTGGSRRREPRASSEAPADKIAFSLRCRNEEHYPYLLQLTEVEENVRFLKAWVRTESGAWDGCGGRTDLHEIFATLWAAILRANGVASAELIDIGGWFPGEISARALVIRQPFDAFLRPAQASYFERVRAHTASASHWLTEAFALRGSQDVKPEWHDRSLPWLECVRTHFGCTPKDELFVERINPTWRYYKAGSNLTLLELPQQSALRLRAAFSFYAPESVSWGNRLIISAGGIHNSVPLRALRKAEKVLRLIDSSPYARFSGGDARFDTPSLLIVPLENHCVLIGASGVAIVRTDCGYGPFLKAREGWDGPGRRAAAIFGQSGSFEWSSNLDSGRFEQLAEELLEVESGVKRVRTAGPHTERDQGRDLIVDWVKIVDAASDPPKFRTDVVLAQVKTRNRTVGKGDVRDVRDTIERHSAAGFLLIGYPRLSGDLINYLETQRRCGHSIDWWSRKEIEERLRKNLDVTARYGDLVRYKPPTHKDESQGQA